MNADGKRGSIAVVGAAVFGLGEAPGYSAAELLGRAATLALNEAGLGIRDVDGLFALSPYHPHAALSFSEYFGIRPKIADSTVLGGASFLSYFTSAALAIEAGLCDVALICYGSNQRSGMAGKRGRVISPLLEKLPYEDVYHPLLPISSYALAAARHMYEFGTTREQLAEAAVAARKWAQLNPEAYARGPLSIDEVLAARMVSDPLTTRDCCLVTDGAGAVVLVRAERARDFPKPPVYLLGSATAYSHRQISSMPDLTRTAAKESSERAYAMAKISAQDVDVVELYDAFTINTIMFLEDLGFCKKGEGGAFVGGGGIAPGGRLPVNTNGGGLSCCHPGMYGIFTVIEAVRQLRGEAGDRQISGAEIALAHGNGGVFSCQSTALFGAAATL
jgi:acetyl-CoA acetyltransferase